jgi:hypothetical protein
MEPHITAHLHRTKGWLMVPIRVGGRYGVEMVLDTGSAVSTISQGVRVALADLGLLESRGGNRNLLREVEIQGQRLPDLRVRESRRITLVGASGALGLDFLNRFREIHVDVPHLRFTLTGPDDPQR